MVQVVSPVQLTSGEPLSFAASLSPSIASWTTFATASSLTTSDCGAEYEGGDEPPTATARVEMKWRKPGRTVCFTVSDKRKASAATASDVVDTNMVRIEEVNEAAAVNISRYRLSVEAKLVSNLSRSSDIRALVSIGSI